MIVISAQVGTVSIENVVLLSFRYDQTLFEDESKNRMTETKELFEWVLKQPCFEVVSDISTPLMNPFLLSSSHELIAMANIF